MSRLPRATEGRSGGIKRKRERGYLDGNPFWCTLPLTTINRLLGLLTTLGRIRSIRRFDDF